MQVSTVSWCKLVWVRMDASLILGYSYVHALIYNHGQPHHATSESSHATAAAATPNNTKM